MNGENNLAKIADILKMSVEELESNSKRVDDLDAMYYWNPTRGGISMIISSNGEYLAATSSISFEKLLSEFKQGRRNGKIDN